jgi:hypothetical protein
MCMDSSLITLWFIVWVEDASGSVKQESKRCLWEGVVWSKDNIIFEFLPPSPYLSVHQIVSCVGGTYKQE